MISAYTVEGKKSKKIILKEINSKGTVWIRSVSPDPVEIEKLSKIVNVPAAEFNEFLEEEERPRLSKDKYLQIIFGTPFKEGGEISTIPISVFIYKNIVLTLEKEKVFVLSKFEDRLLKNMSPFLLSQGPAYFVFIMLDKINDQFLSYINNIDDMSAILKKKVKKFDPDTVERIYNYSVTLSFFHQALSANHEVLNSLKKSHYTIFKNKDRTNFNELYIDSLAIIDSANVQREMMSNLFNLQTVLSQQNLNRFMNKITLIAVIIMIPTLISGIYGMNLSNLPFSGYKNGFFIILGLMFTLTALVTLFVVKINKN